MEEYTIQSSVVNFLYNGCVAFFPEIFSLGEEKKQPAVFYSGFNKEEFEKLIKEITLSRDVNAAVQIIRVWKIKSDRGETVKSTVPINIEELVEFLETEKEKKTGINRKGKNKSKIFYQTDNSRQNKRAKVRTDKT